MGHRKHGDGPEVNGGIGMKAVAAVLIAFVLALTIGISDGSDAETEGDLQYTVVNGEAWITGNTIDSLTDLEIPDHLSGYPVAVIDSGAFADCTNLRSVTLPGTVRSVHHTAFLGCSSLESFTVPDSEHYQAIGGVLFEAGGHTLVRYPAGSMLTAYTVPTGTVTVNPYAFAGSGNLEILTLPYTVKTIHNHGLSDCTSLVTVTLPSGGITTLGEEAMSGCTSLGIVSFPDSATTFGARVFSGCTSLSSVRLPTNMSSLPSGFFQGCESLASVELPVSVGSIGAYVFKGCSVLERIDIKCQTLISVSSDALSIGTSGAPRSGITVNCVSPGFDPEDYCDQYTSGFLLNQSTFHIDLYSDNVLYKRYDFLPDQEVVLDDVPTRTGYNLSWNNTIPEKMTVGDIRADAIWTADQYDITYSDGTSTYSQTATYGTVVNLVTVQFYRGDKVFSNWTDPSSNTYPDCAAVDHAAMYNGGEGITLTAQWADPAFIVRFIPNGAMGTMLDQPVALDTYTMLRANAFVKEGYLFGGWSYGGLTYSDGQIVRNLKTDGSVIEFSALWTPIIYHVVYWLNGGSGTAPERTVNYDESFILPGSNVSRDGYDLLGWSKSPSATSPTYIPSQNVSRLTTVNGSTVNLYAVWSEIHLTIIFHANGGTGTMADQTILLGDTANLELCTFHKSTAFKGWANSPTGDAVYSDGQEITFTGPVSATLDLYAVWAQSELENNDMLLIAGVASIIAVVLVSIAAIVVIRR